MREELVRQSMHLLYGVSLSLVLTIEPLIGVALTLLFVAASLAHRKRELPILGGILRRIDRGDPLPAFGAITLTGAITSVFLILPEHALIAGLGVAIIDSLATAIGIIESGRKKILASLFGGAVFFVVTTSAFSDVSTLSLALAALAGSAAEFFTNRLGLVDDNVTITWSVAIVLAFL